MRMRGDDYVDPADLLGLKIAESAAPRHAPVDQGYLADGGLNENAVALAHVDDVDDELAIILLGSRCRSRALGRSCFDRSAVSSTHHAPARLHRRGRTDDHRAAGTLAA